MDLSLPIPGLADVPEAVEQPPFAVNLTRQPWGDYFTLKYVKNGKEASEELEAEATLQWFMDHMTKAPSRKAEKDREEAIGKALDECWNFYQTVIYIPAAVYKEPVLPFPQFQPQV